MSMTPRAPFGSTGARAARRMPGMRLAVSVAPVSRAPVLPADTTASPSPARSILSATAMLESFLRRVAVLGSSSMVMTSRASTMSAFASPTRGSILSFWPMSVTSTPSSLAALSAPRTGELGALSPPMASISILNRKKPPLL